MQAVEATSLSRWFSWVRIPYALLKNLPPTPGVSPSTRGRLKVDTYRKGGFLKKYARYGSGLSSKTHNLGIGCSNHPRATKQLKINGSNQVFVIIFL